MTTCIVSLFFPVKTSVRHDEVSSLSINPVIELRERRRDVHTEEVKGLPRSSFHSFIPPSVSPSFLHTHTDYRLMRHPTFMHICSSLPLYLLVHSICQSALFRCTSAEISALALAAIILLSVQRALHYDKELCREERCKWHLIIVSSTSISQHYILSEAVSWSYGVFIHVFLSAL